MKCSKLLEWPKRLIAGKDYNSACANLPRVLEKELEGNRHAAFWKKGSSQPELQETFLTQSFHVIIKVLTGDKFPGAQEFVAHCDGGEFNPVLDEIQETQMLKAQKILFKDVQSMWLSQRPNGEKQYQDWAMNHPLGQKKPPHNVSLVSKKNFFKDQWKHYLNLQKNVWSILHF